MQEERPNPNALLEQYHLNEDDRRGRLKIFFGYAAGVGKTYAMLKAAHRARREGIDVVAGYIEPHMRPETERLTHGIETLPVKAIAYRGITLREFDIDAALARKPQLILVDELAHTNAEGSRHAKRYQDVEELLRAGIDVYTTVNVQHIESLNDTVASITGISVRERVPDKIFDLAEQVEVVDIEPNDLITRLKEGRIYRGGQAGRALTAFFSEKNLASLREIALRRTADRLSRSAEKRGVSGARDLILTGLSPAPSNARVIRTAARMSEALDARFIALFVEGSGYAQMPDASRKRLSDHMKIAEDLGAQIVTVYGDDVAVQIAEYARLSGATRVVLGRTNHRRGIFGSRRGLVDTLTQIAPNLDIYIIPDAQPEYKTGFRRRYTGRRERIGPAKMAMGAGMMLLATLIGFAFERIGLREANIIMVYLMAALLTANATGSTLCSGVSSLMGVLLFNFFFTEPRFTFEAYDPGYPVTFAMMLFCSWMVASLVLRVSMQKREAAQRAYRTEVLLETSQKLQQSGDEAQIFADTAAQLQKLIGRPICFYPIDGQKPGKPMCFGCAGEPFPQRLLEADEVAVTEWVMRNNKRAGAGTNTLPGAKGLYMAVRGRQGALGVAGIGMEGTKPLEPEEKNLIVSLLSECGLALEKEHLQKETQAAQIQMQQEQLRANLLRTISHDLRTPLTSISGHADILQRIGEQMGREQRAELYRSIGDDAAWLIGLVENLLSVTRIENGTMKLNMQTEVVEEIFAEAMTHIDRRAQAHEIDVDAGEELLMAKMDARLIVQVIINLVNNAIAYTPEGSHIALTAAREGKRIRIDVTDDGPGIEKEAREQIFDLFYTATPERGDGHRGLGLGLALCRSITQAHGDGIAVYPVYPHGARFTFTLDAAEVPEHGKDTDTGH